MKLPAMFKRSQDISLIESFLFESKPVNVAISGLSSSGKTVLMKHMVHKGFENHPDKTDIQFIVIDNGNGYRAPQVLASTFPTYDCNALPDDAPFGLNPFAFIHDNLDVDDQARDVVMALRALLAPFILLSNRVDAPAEAIAADLIREFGNEVSLDTYVERLIWSSNANARYLGKALQGAIDNRFLAPAPSISLDDIVLRIEVDWEGEYLVDGVYNTILGMMAIKWHMASTPHIRKIVAIEGLFATPCGGEMRESFFIAYECLYDVIKRLWSTLGQLNASGIALGYPSHADTRNLYHAASHNLDYHVVMYNSHLAYRHTPLLHYTFDDIKAKLYGPIEDCYTQFVLQKVKGKFGTADDIIYEHLIPLRLSLPEVMKVSGEHYVRALIMRHMESGLSFEDACIEVSKTMLGPRMPAQAS